MPELQPVEPEEPTGAVLVVGAGIGGIQAALDLADAGLKAYLLDRSPAIGGVMAQLDKTFPTNDCAMCILSPKLVECGRHLNIQVLTHAELESLSGQPGKYLARVRRHPRYVIEADCTGCGDCAAACPIHLPDAFNLGLSERRAAYKLYPQAIPNAYVIEKAGRAPCRNACPIHQRSQGYIALVREGRYAEAYRTIREDNPFPSVCGRVCNHACEDACSRAKADSPVSIMRLKRFVADWAADHPEEIRPLPAPAVCDAVEPAGRKRVAIVGSGPAGLACAERLVRAGHSATVFETEQVAGGMMRLGIPAHRLPPEVIDREIRALAEAGVVIRLGSPVDDAVGLLDEYDAVFVAVGAQQGVRLPIAGADLPQVTVATDFLRRVALPEGTTDDAREDPAREDPAREDTRRRTTRVRTRGNVATDFLRRVAAPEGEPLQEAFDPAVRPRDVAGRRVLVLGGGSVAMDSATSALRLGAAWVGAACLESRAAMPAHAWEIEDAVAEGIELFPSRVFKEIMASEDGNVAGVRCSEIEFRGFAAGRPDYDEIPGSEHEIKADVVIFAIGQRPESSCMPNEARLRGSTIASDPVTLATCIPGIFAGGDATTGTRFVVEAIAAGQRAARSIDAYLRGDPLPGQEAEAVVAELTEADVQARLEGGAVSRLARQEPAKLRPDERARSFREVYDGYTEADAVAEAERCLSCGICSECLQCVYACRKHCIDHEMREESLDLEVGAVILSPGLEPMGGGIRPEYGYGRLANVVTSIEFERMLSASGPWAGEVVRPSDGKHPRRVAFIQCVGCRDTSIDHGYCSSVCCMYATKEAVIAREHDPRVEPTIFYIDVRSFGKGFERYINHAEQDMGVRYVRSAVSSVTEEPGTGNLRLQYATPAGHSVEEVFDLAVLSVGMKPGGPALELARRLGVMTNAYGFAEAPPFAPSRASLTDGSRAEGVFVAGAFAEPRDIPETVITASCAAAGASSLLASARHSLTVERVWPEERDVSDQWPRIGVFICHCGINIGGVVSVPDVVEFARSLPDVVYAEENLYTCSQDMQDRIREQIEAHGLNRVVVASCTPRTHESLFQDTVRQAGLNPHLFQMANIREQVAWVHRGEQLTATEKAMELVRMAAAKARRLSAIDARGQTASSPVIRRALVIGGGLAGMTAALSVAEQGYSVTLVERERELGGNLRHILTPMLNEATRSDRGEIADPQALLARTQEAVLACPGVEVLLGATLEATGGFVGSFHSTVRLADGTRAEIEHGVTIIATGAEQHTPKSFRYGENSRVMTQREFEAWLVANDPGDAAPLVSPMRAVRSVVMIQCVGSRDEEHPYCSRICCTEAIKNAIALNRLSPETEVYILYRDIRTYGFRERDYREARRRGVVFLEYAAGLPPLVHDTEGELHVEVCVQPEGETYILAADRVVLSAGIEPNAANTVLAQQLKVPLTEDRFFLEAHAKLRPLDCAAEGIYLCGMAHSPRFIDETIAQAQGAAMRAVRLLSRRDLDAKPIIASVNPKLCSACGLCVEVCPYDARVLEPDAPTAEVIDVLCQGCGACVVACPNKASQLKGWEASQLYAMLSAVGEVAASGH